MRRAITRCMEMGFSCRDWFFRRGGIIIGYTLLLTLLLIVVLVAFESSDGDVFGCPFWKCGDREERCRARGCKIFCKDVDWMDLKRHLEDLVEDRCDSELEMSIQFNGFSEETVRNGWLKFLDQRVKTLRLRNYPLHSFEDSAFSGRPFTNLRGLIITNSRLNYLSKLWFVDLPTLRDLQITFQDACPVENFWIEEGVLEGMPALETLIINRCLNQPQHLLNLTGPFVKGMPKLIKINFSDNRLRSVPSQSFKAAYNLEYLSLHENMLQEIARDALWPMPLCFLEISNNNLQNLSRDTFKYFDFKPNSIKAFGNPWNCDCQLQWFKITYIKEASPINKIRPLLCADGRHLEEVDFGKCVNPFGIYRTKQDESCTATQCSVKCNGTDYRYLADTINRVVMDCSANLELILESVSFPDGKISTNWLHSLSFSVLTLQFKKCQFNTLNDGAFSGHPFENLNKLEMIDPDIDHIGPGWFDGIEALTTFELRYDVTFPSHGFWIQRGAFGNLYGLSTLQFINCLSDEDHVRNITGPDGGYMKELLTLDVGYNRLGKLSAWSFKNAPKLLKLVIRDNSLKTIDVDAFAGTTLRYLDISGNILKTLPEGVFRVFDKDDFKEKSLYAFNNPWECDCHLAWFRDYYLKNGSFVDQDNRLRCDNEVLFEDSDFRCSGEDPTTTTTTTTEITTTERTESSYGTTRELIPEEKLVSVPCRDINQNPLRPRGGAAREQIVNIAVISNNHSINIRFFDIDDEMITTEINMEGDVGNFHLLWFNSLHTNERDCITYLHNRPIYVTDLKRTQTYTFCLVYDGETSVSPYSCFGTTVPEFWGQRAWIRNVQKTAAIATFASTVVLTAIVFSVSVFFIVRQHPGLIKGNKRVIVLGNKEFSLRPPPLPRTDSGYLTPNCPIYEKVQYRGAGENSISGYITTMENSYKIQTAPPLPPCHPVLNRGERDDDNRDASSA